MPTKVFSTDEGSGVLRGGGDPGGRRGAEPEPAAPGEVLRDSYAPSCLSSESWEHVLALG